MGDRRNVPRKQSREEEGKKAREGGKRGHAGLEVDLRKEGGFQTWPSDEGIVRRQ